MSVSWRGLSQWNYVGERERLVVVPHAAQLPVAASIISPLIKSVVRKERSGSHRVVADHTRSGRATSLAHASSFTERLAGLGRETALRWRGRPLVGLGQRSRLGQ